MEIEQDIRRPAHFSSSPAEIMYEERGGAKSRMWLLLMYLLILEGSYWLPFTFV